jgi:hypothetical protein
LSGHSTRANQLRGAVRDRDKRIIRDVVRQHHRAVRASHNLEVPPHRHACDDLYPTPVGMIWGRIGPFQGPWSGSQPIRPIAKRAIKSSTYAGRTPRIAGPSPTRPERFELPTFGSVDRRSIQLSYGRPRGDPASCKNPPPTAPAQSSASDRDGESGSIVSGRRPGHRAIFAFRGLRTRLESDPIGNTHRTLTRSTSWVRSIIHRKQAIDGT